MLLLSTLHTNMLVSGTGRTEMKSSQTRWKCEIP